MSVRFIYVFLCTPLQFLRRKNKRKNTYSIANCTGWCIRGGGRG